MHAIGDLANRNALDAFEDTKELWQPLGLRHRIEHTQCLTPEDVPRFAELGLTASVQFCHAPSDEELAHRFWADRLDGVYSFRSLLDAGTRLINGSDAPIEELLPWQGIIDGVLRHWREDQRVTLEEALAATCVAPAWQTYDERRRGKLIPGYLADLVVLDRDPLAIPLEELLRSRSSRRWSAAAGRITPLPGERSRRLCRLARSRGGQPVPPRAPSLTGPHLCIRSCRARHVGRGGDGEVDREPKPRTASRANWSRPGSLSRGAEGSACRG